jgi:acyl-CoA synthetase (AMP-forming)/AMP-acid ligase II
MKFLTLIDLLQDKALNQADQYAYTILLNGEKEKSSITYAELDRQSRAIGTLLQNLGLVGQRILLVYPPGLSYIAAFFGCLYAGCVAVPVYPPCLNRSLERLQGILLDCQATSDTSTECPPGKIGEVWISDPGVAQGYWDRPEQTEYTFHASLADSGKGPFLRTGDLGFLLDGKLFITGRLKDLIIIRGRNHYPQDIEMTSERCHPALQIGSCAAFSCEIDGEERLIIAQELKREKFTHHPLSYGQSALWFMQALSPESGIFNIAVDFWALTVLVDELIQFYTAQKNDTDLILLKRQVNHAFQSADLDVL